MAETNVPDLRVVGDQEGGPDDLVGEYLRTLGGRSASTVDAYGRILRALAGWVSERPGGSGRFLDAIHHARENGGHDNEARRPRRTIFAVS